MNIRILSILFLSAFAILATGHAQSIAEVRKQVLADSAVSADIKNAIARGVVIKGMCPQEAFAAAGFPGPYMVIADKSKWPPHTPPPVIVNAQCKNPDNSIIELKFRNSMQFGGKDPVVFRVRFEKGRAVLIDQNAFSKE
jgi:hypothetical protein